MATPPVPPPPPARLDPATLMNLLIYGSPGTRQRLAQDLARRDDPALRGLLPATVRSGEPWLLRARCLEVLGIAAGHGEQQVAEAILRAIQDPPA